MPTARAAACATALGIGTEHLGGIGRHVQLLFRADLSAVLGDHAHALYALYAPGGRGAC